MKGGKDLGLGIPSSLSLSKAIALVIMLFGDTKLDAQR